MMPSKPLAFDGKSSARKYPCFLCTSFDDRGEKLEQEVIQHEATVELCAPLLSGQSQKRKRRTEIIPLRPEVVV